MVHNELLEVSVELNKQKNVVSLQSAAVPSGVLGSRPHLLRHRALVDLGENGLLSLEVVNLASEQQRKTENQRRSSGMSVPGVD